MRQAYCFGQPLIQNSYVVVLLHGFHHAAQHDDGAIFGGLFHLDYLETPRQRGILLEVFLVLGPGGCCNRPQFTTGEWRLQ